MPNTNSDNSQVGDINRRPPYPPPYPPPCPPPYPPYPPYPYPHDQLPIKKVVLTKKFNHVLYELAVRTNTESVFDKSYRYTLGEMLEDITNGLTTNLKATAKLSKSFNRLMKDCPEEFDTLKEIADYINVNGDPKSALMELIDNKVDKVEGKGLSTHDLTDILYDKLVNGYSKEQIDAIYQTCLDSDNALNIRINALENKTNVVVDEVEDIKDGDVWFKINSEYTPSDDDEIVDP